MIAYKREKLENALSYIIKIHETLAKKEATQTYIYKYMALVDFKSLEETGRPVFDFDYIALKKGPVPAKLYDFRENIVDDEDFFDVIKLKMTDEGNFVYKNKKEPDLDYLSDYEINLIETTVESYANEKVKTQHLIDATHEKIKAWDTAWEHRDGVDRVIIDPLDTFEDIKTKEQEELSPTEEIALFYHALRRKYLQQRCF